jgi:hypothetical protein
MAPEGCFSVVAGLAGAAVFLAVCAEAFGVFWPSCASWRSRTVRNSFSNRNCSSSFIGAVDRGGGISCTAGYWYGVTGRAGAFFGKPISPGIWSIIGPGAQQARTAVAAKTVKIDAGKVRTMFRYARLKGEIDADSMNYSINRLSGYYGFGKVIGRQQGPSRVKLALR